MGGSHNLSPTFLQFQLRAMSTTTSTFTSSWSCPAVSKQEVVVGWEEVGWHHPWHGPQLPHQRQLKAERGPGPPAFESTGGTVAGCPKPVCLSLLTQTSAVLSGLPQIWCHIPHRCMAPFLGWWFFPLYRRLCKPHPHLPSGYARGIVRVHRFQPGKMLQE